MAELTEVRAEGRDALIRSLRMVRVKGPAGDLLAGPELGGWIEHLVDALLAPGGAVAETLRQRDEALDLLSARTREKWEAEDREARLRARVEAVNFTSRRLGMAFPDPEREGWNHALDVCQADLRAALSELVGEGGDDRG